jgi:hypothetical protein
MDEKDLFSKAAVEFAAKLTRESRTLKEEYKELLGIKTKLNDYDKEAVNLADKVQQSAKQNIVELGRSGDLAKEITKDRKLSLDLERELVIASKLLSKTESDAAQAILKNYEFRESTLNEIENIQERILNAEGEELETLLKNKNVLFEGLEILQNQFDLLIESSTTDSQRYALALKTKQIQDENIEGKRKEANIQDQINQKLGIAGNFLVGTEEFLGKFAKGFNLEKVTEHMQEFADEAVRSGKEVSRLQVLGEGVKAAFSNLGKTLTDPTVVIAAMVEGFGEMEKQQREFRKLTGQNVDVFDTLNGKITTSAEYIKAASELSKELGVNASVVFTPETIVEVAELTDNMGMAVKEAANLAKLSKVTGTELVDNAHAIEHGFQSFVKTNKTALNFGQVMSDVGNASSALTISLGSNPERIAEAAMEARKLGLSLEQVDKIADSLLNFEESISAELEAELLTGKDLNLEKAREAALNNDIATLSKEIGKNQEVLSAFSSGNRIQQEAVAKAMGMSREDMAKMIYQQKIQNGLSAEQASKAADISLAEAQRLSAQEQISKAVEKLTQLAGMLLTPLNLILSNTVTLGIVFGVIAVATLPKIISGVKGFVGSLQEGLSTTKELAKNFLGLFKPGGIKEAGGKIKDFLGGGADKTKDIAGKAGDDISKTADKTKNVKGDAGKGIKQFLTGLGDGLASIGNQWGAVMKGSVALGVAGLVLGGSFALAMKMVENVEPAQMLAFASSLSMLGLTVALLGKIGSQVIQGAVALGILAVSLIPAAYAFSLLAGVDVDSIIAFSIALPLLSLAAAGLGFIAPFIIAGAAAFAVLGASLIPFAMALKLVQGVDATSFFDSLQKAITPQLALSTYAMAGALIALAAGFGTFAIAMGAAGIVSFFAGDGVLSQLETLASMANPLQTVANSLTQMAAGLLGVAEALNQIDEDKLESLNEFAEVSPLAAVGNAIGGAIEALFGGGEEKQTSPELAEIRDILNQILKKDTNIYMDSTKVGTGFAMGTSKVQ